MKRMFTAAAAAAVALTSLSGAALAQPGPGPGPDRHGPPGYDRHDDRRPPGNAYGRHRWRQGERIRRDEWRRYRVVDWRRHHLRRPPRGYEWRQVNGDYVLAAAATGLIAAIIAAGQ